MLSHHTHCNPLLSVLPVFPVLVSLRHLASALVNLTTRHQPEVQSAIPYYTLLFYAILRIASRMLG